MKKLFFFLITIVAFASCNSDSAMKSTNISKDTTSYPYKALYSSDLSMSANPENTKKVLTVWKMYESKQFDAMKKFYADTVTYEDAGGFYYHGPSQGLLDVAKKIMDQFDSLRFDISMWESIHSNDKNEDWVNVWCNERVYPKSGGADTSRMYEQWKIRDGKIYYFNQYNANLPNVSPKNHEKGNPK